MFSSSLHTLLLLLWLSAESSALVLIDPYSSTARTLCTDHLGLTQQQFEQCQGLCDALVEWNARINLISRKDCNEAVVFTRHLLPSLCAPSTYFHADTTVLDVGTGGGFPGLPLAIQYPETNFVLLDSVGKKLKAVKAIAESLGLDNVVGIHHGRVEDYPADSVDVVTGRSVTAVPQFCAWTQHVLKNNDDSRMLYWTGGEIPRSESDLAVDMFSIRDALVDPTMGLDNMDDAENEKKILVFDQDAVRQLGDGIVVQRTTPKGEKRSKTKRSRVKGAWKSREEPRQRGYEGFRRFNSLGEQ